MKGKLPTDIYQTTTCQGLLDKSRAPFIVTNEKCSLPVPRSWCSHAVGMELVAYISGHGVLRTPTVENHMRRGSICLIPPHVQTMHIASPGNQINYWNFLFLEDRLQIGDIFIPDMKNYQELCHMQGSGANRISNVFHIDASLMSDIDTMASEILAVQTFNYPGWQAYCSSAFLYLLVRILKEFKKDKQSFSSIENRIEQIANFIERNCSQSLFLDMLAKKADMSPSSLSHHFKKVKKVSPVEYLIRCRLRKALSMFAYCNDICQIAYECGFGEQSYFSRTFRRRIGLSPSQFKQLSIEKQMQIIEKLA
ncbi:MAG: helix-turn-helix transcriptional regulator [Acholeplasmataceae bacterium]|nr:helix-turn-helix transcriptional regulator [Acholeplasmataceae bacterium]